MAGTIQIYEVIPTDNFNDDIKFYIKKKKFTKIMKDIESILEELSNGIFNGDVIADLHLENNTYKIRSANSNTKEGKSNGYRLIYYVEELDKVVFLITIYYKKDDNRVPTDSEIVELIKKYCL